MAVGNMDSEYRSNFWELLWGLTMVLWSFPCLLSCECHLYFSKFPITWDHQRVFGFGEPEKVSSSPGQVRRQRFLLTHLYSLAPLAPSAITKSSFMQPLCVPGLKTPVVSRILIGNHIPSPEVHITTSRFEVKCQCRFCCEGICKWNSCPTLSDVKKVYPAWACLNHVSFYWRKDPKFERVLMWGIFSCWPPDRNIDTLWEGPGEVHMRRNAGSPWELNLDPCWQIGDKETSVLPSQGTELYPESEG